MASKSDSSWHPAMMPNSAADVVARESNPKSNLAQSPSHVSPVAPSVAEEVLRLEALPDQNDQDEASAWLDSENTVAIDPIETSQDQAEIQIPESPKDTVPMEPITTGVPALSRPPEEDASSEHGDSADAWLTNGDGGSLHRDDAYDTGSVEQNALSTLEENSSIEPLAEPTGFVEQEPPSTVEAESSIEALAEPTGSVKEEASSTLEAEPSNEALAEPIGSVEQEAPLTLDAEPSNEMLTELTDSVEKEASSTLEAEPSIEALAESTVAESTGSVKEEVSSTLEAAASNDTPTQLTGSAEQEAPLAQEAEPSNEVLAESNPEEPSATVVEGTGSVPSTAQHASSMSFARTVSHEISFPDDDDGEWNLGQSEAEAFAVMPPSHRTNSFPAVPSMDSEISAQVDMPLTSNQAQNVMEEDAKVAESEEEYMMRSPVGDSSVTWHRHGTNRSQAIPHRPIGGELEDTAAMEAVARFDEGLPLIPHSEAVVDDGTQQSSARSTVDPFAEQGDNEDDFFGQVTKDLETQNDEETNAKHVERKSTAQVMEAIGDGGSLTRDSTPNNTLEEEADISSKGFSLGTSGNVEGPPVTEDLASKWEEAFGDDDEDEFLLDESTAEVKDVDATAFLGSDDEGLLDDDLDAQAPTTAPSQPRQPVVNPYAPAPVAAQSTTAYIPASATGFTPPPTFGYGGQQQQANVTPYGAGQFGQTPQPLRPAPVKTQSFVDKSKAGYSSPYDLPTDLVKTVKPRKRSSLQQLPTNTAPPPLTSASSYSPGQSAPPPPAPATTAVPPLSAAARPPLAHKASAPVLHSKGGFFEELPISAKPRSASRQSQRASSSSGQYLPMGSAPQQVPQPPPPPPPISRTVPPPAASRMAPPPAPQIASPPAQYTNNEAGVPNLTAPPRENPYANVQSQAGAAVTPPANNPSRYSPAPPGPQGGGVPVTSRYSPGPSSGSRPNSSYGAGSTHTSLPHLPRTSSPLAHFETSGAADGQPYDRRAGSAFEPRLNRVSSLPPTREVDEEEDEQAVSPESRSFSTNHAVVTTPTATAAGTSHAPVMPHATGRLATPPPVTPGAGYASFTSAATLSPPKRAHSNYTPQPAAAAGAASAQIPPVVPPPRARTQSPSALRIDARKGSKPVDYAPRPLPALSPPLVSVAPAATTSNPTQSSSFAPTSRIRGQSISNMVPPTDGRERDPLERWRGAPVMAWGVGGTFITSFPKSIPRYTMGNSVPVTIRAVGEVKVQNIKDVDSLSDSIAKFPGPLKGKSKKKEAIAWLTAGIDSQEREIPDVSFHSQLSLEAKRSVERLLLWKLLRIFIENDGVLEGSTAVDKAVRQVLASDTAESRSESAPLFTGAEAGAGSTSMKADGVDQGTVETIRLDLLRGDRETAVWAAVDKRLWGHAMLISQTVSADLYKQVAQEFVRKEVNYPGHNNESLAALYKVLSGNYDDCVDELVPSHARAGLQLVSTETSSGPTKDAMDGLDKWRETLTLVLSNRSSDDIRGLNALGKLLSSYGRAEAAHICFIFSRSLSVFGGLDDANSDFVLLGSDHKRQSEQFAKEAEALQLSEMYEYGLTLGGGVAASAGAPHLAAYKLQHAVTLAEYGFRDKAIQYCDAIASAIVAQTRRSPYHHPVLEASVEDFLARLKSSPKDASSSWMSKPTMGKVSDSMWNRFNKFVAGEEDGNGHAGPEGDNGPFAHISSSPNISRPPSASNFDVYGSSPAGYQTGAGASLAGSGTAVSSRYAPASAAPHASASANPYAPAPQPQHVPIAASSRSSQEYASNSYDPAYSGAAGLVQTQSGGGGGGAEYQSVGYPGPVSPEYRPPMPTYASSYAEPVSTMQSVPAASGGYQPLGLQESPVIHPQPPAKDDTNQGYQPQSYGYEPPQASAAVPADDNDQQGASSGGYEPPSFQPYGYEPPSYEPPSYQPDLDEDESPKPKKKSFMDDDDDDIPALKAPQTQAKSDKDRENEEMFRKVAEEDAKRAAAAASAKKGWGFGGWFGGSKKGEGSTSADSSTGKPIKAKLGEQSTFVYDPDLGRWINKKPGAENVEAKKATPPPPRAGISRSVGGTPPPPPSVTNTPPPAADGSNLRPVGAMLPPRSTAGTLTTAQSMDNIHARSGPGSLARSVSTSAVLPGEGGPPVSAPPSRPSTSMSMNNATSIDDLLGAPGPRKAGPKKPRKSGRYVDVMAAK
ncbi:hypothetical protein E4U14_001504 [Claviceps sp. LM454 group G7]|nr:hypothetical protein E4U14_001504 [Claviceps sp. LM454 group G7]